MEKITRKKETFTFNYFIPFFSSGHDMLVDVYVAKRIQHAHQTIFGIQKNVNVKLSFNQLVPKDLSIR